MTRGAKAFIAICVAGSVVTVWFMLGQREGVERGASSAAADLVQQYEPVDREEIDDFTASMLDGASLERDDLRGQVSVFNVWGSWCGPCRTEAPDLVAAAKELGQRVQFYGINVRDSPDAARAFERAFTIPYSSIHPADSATAILAFRGTLTAAAVPSTVIVDPSGAVAARVVGQVDKATLIGLVEDVLAEDGD